MNRYEEKYMWARIVRALDLELDSAEAIAEAAEFRDAIDDEAVRLQVAEDARLGARGEALVEIFPREGENINVLIDDEEKAITAVGFEVFDWDAGNDLEKPVLRYGLPPLRASSGEEQLHLHARPHPHGGMGR